MTEVSTTTVFEQLLEGREPIGGAMDYKRLPGCWISERKYGALICRVDPKSTAAKHDVRPKGCTKTSNGYQLKVLEANIDEGKQFVTRIVTAHLAAKAAKDAENKPAESEPVAAAA